jgi:hypothetical protein
LKVIYINILRKEEGAQFLLSTLTLTLPHQRGRGKFLKLQISLVN